MFLREAGPGWQVCCASIIFTKNLVLEVFNLNAVCLFEYSFSEGINEN